MPLTAPTTGLLALFSRVQSSSSESSSLSRKSVGHAEQTAHLHDLIHIGHGLRALPLAHGLACDAELLLPAPSCDQPAFLRRAVILSANIIREVLRFRRARHLFDGQSIPLFAVADKKDGQEICQSTVARRAENGSARSFFRNGSPWASICGTYSKGERRCW